ncbi:hypothetical protein M2421_001626 [Stenotrophomonas sp. BIGb0135]|nr:hypothetical protein [Stenotrophomonas sp. BIGb0135]
MTAADRAAHRYAIGHMAAYFLAFCFGVAFSLIVGAL